MIYQHLFVHNNCPVYIFRHGQETRGKKVCSFTFFNDYFLWILLKKFDLFLTIYLFIKKIHRATLRRAGHKIGFFTLWVCFTTKMQYASLPFLPLKCSVAPPQKCHLKARIMLTTSSETQGKSGVSWEKARKVFKHGWKSSCVATLTRPFPNGQTNAGSWLGSKNTFWYCAQSANSKDYPELFSCSLTRRLLSRHTCPVR